MPRNAKFEKNFKVFKEMPHFYPKIITSAESCGLQKVSKFVIDANDQERGDFDKFQRKARLLFLGRLLQLKWWPYVLKGFTSWVKRTWDLHFPVRGCAPRVEIIGWNTGEIEQFTDLIINSSKERLPFPDVRSHWGRIKRKQISGGSLLRLLDNGRSGWSRDLRDSSWLVLILQKWRAIGDGFPDTGDKITEGDVLLLLNPPPTFQNRLGVEVLRFSEGSISAAVNRALRLIEVGFMKNLNCEPPISS